MREIIVKLICVDAPNTILVRIIRRWNRQGAGAVVRKIVAGSPRRVPANRLIKAIRDVSFLR